VLLTITIMLIIFEGLFLFRPAVKEFRKEWQQKTVEHISARQDDQRKLSYLARFDPLTGLINRFLFGDRLQSAIARARRDGGLVSLMFLDLDEFKAINDRYGHSTGDGLLKQVAQRLVDSVRESDSVARLGGDEFTVVLEGNHRVEDAGNVATKILHSLAEPYKVGSHELYVTASIGIALYPVDGQSAHDLLRDADIAMYSAKAAGKNTYQYFTPELREQTTERLHLIDGLRKAVEARHELALVYQPKVDIRGGAVIGVEALVRWHHPELGLVLPDRFVPVAEQTDLILPIGEWVIAEACRQMKTWIGSGLEFTVSVNISSRQLRHGDLVVTVAQALEDADLEPHYLEVELTEGTLVEDTELAARTLERLRSMGVQVSIDDFGTGYSSLSYLKRLPIDRLKIDRSFVRDITVNEDSAALSAAIVGLAKSLRLDVVAEGVETLDQLRVLEELGCHIVQGFYFSKPMDPDKMPAFVNEGLAAVIAETELVTPHLRESAG
jgi:diguanylate cyclase (GGDEF)-like protein